LSFKGRKAWAKMKEEFQNKRNQLSLSILPIIIF